MTSRGGRELIAGDRDARNRDRGFDLIPVEDDRLFGCPDPVARGLAQLGLVKGTGTVEVGAPIVGEVVVDALSEVAWATSTTSSH